MNLIEFANPIGWWWAALALPIVAFYMLRVRLRRQPVSTMRFWDQVFEEKKNPHVVATVAALAVSAVAADIAVATCGRFGRPAVEWAEEPASTMGRDCR